MLKNCFVFLFLSLPISALSQECAEVPVQLIINSGAWAEEINWSIIDATGALIDSSNTLYQNNIEYSHNLCLNANTCYQFVLHDSYVDGWNGATYTLQYADSVSIASGSLAPSLFNAFDDFCLNNGNLCTTNILSLQIETNIWAEEISWAISDTTGLVLHALSDVYTDSSMYALNLCISNGCYYFNMFDTYGDGWQGAFFELVNNENTVAQGALENDSVGQIAFSINGDCTFDVCNDDLAINYNQVGTTNANCFYVSENTSLLGNWFDNTLELNSLGGSYSDVYGYAANYREYAVIGSTYGTHIIDVTNPIEPIEITRIQGAFSSASVTHRDFHIYGKYLYAVCDQAESSLQIIDLSNLPESVELVYDSDTLFSRSHNIFIDTLTQKLYSCSTKGFDTLNNYWTSSLCVYDISNPVVPTLLHNMNEYIPNTHDIWVNNDTAYINCPGTGTLVWEFLNVPSQLSTFSSYPDFGTNHSGWKSGTNYVFADENSGYDLKLVDVTDPSNLELISTFNSDINPFSIAHNLMIKDNLVFVSYYHDGLQVFDITNPLNPERVAYYDTYMPENTGGYAGSWGVYCFLPSGNILISDVQSGLFVLKMNFEQQQEIQVQEGWNMVSTYLNDSELSASLFLEAILDEVVLMKNNLGFAFLPFWAYDGIGLMEYGEGYQIKVLNDATIVVNGVFIAGSSIALNTGWNMIGVLSQSPLNIEVLLSSIAEQVVLAKNSVGTAYLPQWNFNGIGDALPGQAYQIKTLSEVQLIFDE